MSDGPLTHQPRPQAPSGAGSRCACFLYGLAFRLARSLAIPSSDLADKNKSQEGAFSQRAQCFSSCAPPEARGRLKPAGS
jgi:hypothetical protein